MDCILINTSATVNKVLIGQLELPVFYSSGDFANVNNSEYLEIDENRKREINIEAFDKVLRWGSVKIEGRNVNDLLSVDGFNFWQYHKFRVYFNVRNILFEIEILQELKEKGYTNITLYSDYTYSVNDFVKDVNINKVEISSAGKKNYSTIAKYLIVFIIRSLIDVFKQPRGIKHLVVDSSIEQPCIKPDGKIVNDNYTLGYLFDKFGDEFMILDELITPKFNQKFTIKKSYFFNSNKKRKALKTDAILLKGLCSGKVRGKLQLIQNKIISNLDIVKLNVSSPIDILILESINQFLPSNKLYLFRYLSFQKFFSNSNFLSITATDENGPIARAILDAGKSESLITVGVQHGAIHRLHPNYVFTKQEQKFTPDYTFVWGEKWSNLLKKIGNYRSESLLVTGQIRTDIIPFLLKEENESHKFTVVYASQPQRDSALREKTAVDVMNAVKQIQGCHLKIKLHPNERFDIPYYKKLAEKTGLENIEILNNAELYLTLAESDVVITSFSTVGTEVVYFNKPLIIYDPLKQDLQNYVKEGVGLQAFNSEDIERYLRDVKNGAKVVSYDFYHEFVKNNAFKIDGKVSERCLNFYSSLKNEPV